MGKLRILCLHGFGQNAVKFRGKTGALRRVLDKVAELDYVEGTYQLMPLSAPAETELTEVPVFKAWWNYSEETGEYRGWKESVTKVQDYIQEHGPFDGILGFSQGAAMTSIICALQHQQQRQQQLQSIAPVSHPPFEFAIMCGGFAPRDPEIKALFDSVLHLPSLHIIGDKDDVVRPVRSQELAALFENACIYRHSSGHLFPTNAEAASVYRDFLSAFTKPTPASSL